ncbi:MAG: DUF2125 domain-containing protein [Rhodospirillales bacterium]|nr:DUF2125 domain-containing protein [Rhodospirillales bacterium]
MADFDNPTIMKRRRPWLIAAAVLALLGLAYSGFWFTMALNSREAVIQWIDEQHAQGVAVSYDSLEATGFPLSIRLEFINPGFAAPGTTMPWGWEGAHLSLLFKPWDMDTARAITSGPQTLAIPINGKTETFNGEALHAQVSVKVSGGEAKSVALRLEGIDLEAERPGLAAIRVAKASVNVQRLITGKADHQSASASLGGSLQGLGGPWLTASPLGGNVENLTLKAHLMGSFDAQPLVESLENWRDSGGTIEISKLHLQHGPLKISADGTLAFDGTLQPIGALTARIEGFFEVIDALQRLGAVKPRDAVTAKMVLGILSRKPDNGGPAHLNLALTAQGNKLYAGPIGLMEIPEIDWQQFRK